MAGKRIRKSTRKNDFVYDFSRNKSAKNKIEIDQPITENQFEGESGTPPNSPTRNVGTMAEPYESSSDSNPEVSRKRSVGTMAEPDQTSSDSEYEVPAKRSVGTIPEPYETSSDSSPEDSPKKDSEEDSSDPEVNEAINKIYTSFQSGAAMSAGIEKFIKKKRSLSLHKQRRKIFPRRRFITHQPSDTIMADLVFYDGMKHANNNYRYVLTVIDCFNRKAWTRPLKSKSAESVAENLDDILASMHHPPRRFCSDRGTGKTV